MATVILQDIVRPLRPNLSDSRAALITKIISLVLGAVSIALILIAKHFGTGIFSVKYQKLMQYRLCFVCVSQYIILFYAFSSCCF